MDKILKKRQEKYLESIALMLEEKQLKGLSKEQKELLEDYLEVASYNWGEGYSLDENIKSIENTTEIKFKDFEKEIGNTVRNIKISRQKEQELQEIEKILFLDCPYCNSRGEREYFNFSPWPSLEECRNCEGTGKLEISSKDEWQHIIKQIFNNYENWDKNFRDVE